jgi:hypothetical protein
VGSDACRYLVAALLVSECGQRLSLLRGGLSPRRYSSLLEALPLPGMMVLATSRSPGLLSGAATGSRGGEVGFGRASRSWNFPPDRGDGPDRNGCGATRHLPGHVSRQSCRRGQVLAFGNPAGCGRAGDADAMPDRGLARRTRSTAAACRHRAAQQRVHATTVQLVKLCAARRQIAVFRRVQRALAGQSRTASSVGQAMLPMGSGDQYSDD